MSIRAMRHSTALAGSEWRLVQQARPRFKGHQQPKVPLWGYEDESDPTIFAKKIKAASQAGISSFIFDWYWYDDGPFLQAALEKGYLGAPNRKRPSVCNHVGEP